MSTVRHVLWLFGFLAILTGPLVAADLIGKVVGVSDSDSPRRLTPR